MISVILSNGTRRTIEVGSNTMGMRIRAIQITSASDVIGERTEDWFRTSLLTRLVPFGVPQEKPAIGQYRKRSVVVDAWQLIEGARMPEWIIEALRAGVIRPCEGGAIISTLEDGPNGEAKHIASTGDWIIKGVKGELYPCKPEIFALTYEVAE